MSAPERITVRYKNWRGEVSERTITPRGVWFGATEWHPEPQWLLLAFDHKKGADRHFALMDFDFSTTPPPTDFAAFMALAFPWLHEAGADWKNMKTVWDAGWKAGRAHDA